METFTIGLRSPWWFRALGRNPLVRLSDRIEAMALVIAVVVTVLMIPIAGAIGTSVHDERARMYADEAQSKHQVIATAIEDGRVVPNLRSIAFTAEASWSEGGRTRRGVVQWPYLAKINDQQTIWVDNNGENVAQLSSPSRADGEAIGVALVIWLGIAVAAAALFYLVRLRLNHWRGAQWDREITASRGNDGWRRYQR